MVRDGRALLMAADSWLRRASGLLVPQMSFANNLLGRWQPCPENCCGPESCEDCFVTLPTNLWADLPPLANGICAACDYWDRTVQTSPYDNECWRKYTEGGLSDPTDCGFFPTTSMVVTVGVTYISEKCWLACSLHEYPDGHNWQWRKEMTPPITNFNQILPFYWQLSSSKCDATGTTVHVY